MEPFEYSDVPRYGAYTEDDLGTDTYDDMSDMLCPRGMEYNADEPWDDAEAIGTGRPLMEATENGGVSINSKAAAELVARGFDRLADAAGAHGKGSVLSHYFDTLHAQARDYVRPDDSGTAHSEELGPLTFESNGSLGNEELERLLDKAIRAGVGETDERSPDSMLARSMVTGYEISKLGPELRAFYGVDGPNPDPDRVAWAIYDRQQQAAEARERNRN